MHINRVKVKDFFVSYDLKNINNKIQIVATFIKNGQDIHKVYNISNGAVHGADMVAKLLDNEFAKTEAEQMIENANQSENSPFKRGIGKMDKKSRYINKFNFRNKEISYTYGWADEETFGFDFGDGEFVDSDNMEYFIRFEYNAIHQGWIIEIWWEDSFVHINELDKADADVYITEQEIEKIKNFIKQLMDIKDKKVCENCCKNCTFAQNYTGYDDFNCAIYGGRRAVKHGCDSFVMCD